MTSRQPVTEATVLRKLIKGPFYVPRCDCQATCMSGLVPYMSGHGAQPGACSLWRSRDANVLTMAVRATIDLPFRVVIGYN